MDKTPNIARLIRAAREIKDSKPRWVIDKTMITVADYLQQHHGKSASDITIACFGLAYKPDIDDLRESPAMEITRMLSSQHPGRVLAAEPNVESQPQDLPGKVSLVTADEALQRTQIAVLLVAHRPFREMRIDIWEKIHVVDACGLLQYRNGGY